MQPDEFPNVGMDLIALTSLRFVVAMNTTSGSVKSHLHLPGQLRGAWKASQRKRLFGVLDKETVCHSGGRKRDSPKIGCPLKGTCRQHVAQRIMGNAKAHTAVWGGPLGPSKAAGSGEAGDIICAPDQIGVVAFEIQ